MINNNNNNQTQLSPQPPPVPAKPKYRPTQTQFVPINGDHHGIKKQPQNGYEVDEVNRIFFDLFCNIDFI